jgi:DNA polymerase-1
MKRILFDLEADGLLEATETAPAVSVVHCIHTVDVDNREDVRAYGPDQIDEAIEYLASTDVLIGQNVLRYDFPVLEKLHGFEVPLDKKLDLMVLSRTKFSNIKELDARLNKGRRAQNKPTMPPEYFGAHTVGAWGWRLGEPKLHEDITDWSRYTPEMGERCAGDVQTSLKWWDYIKVDQIPRPVIELEHEIAHVCELMTQAGWPFDVKAAGALQAKLTDRKFELERKLQQQFGGWFKAKKLFTPKKDDKKRGYVAGQPCTQIEWVDFNPKSHPHIEKVLRGLGWVPTDFTDNGAAKTDEEILESVAAVYPETEGLVEYLMVCKRLGQLSTGQRAWQTEVKANGRIHASYNPMGTVTSRASHFGPNIAQVPKGTAPYGKECRALFHAPEGWEMVGADMEGLELRGLAHYMAKYDDGEFGREVLEGDVHWNNVIGFGYMPPGTLRDKGDPLHDIFRESGAKTGIYAILYGCGNHKLGTIILDVLRIALKKDRGRALPIYKQFFQDAMPGPKELARVGKRSRESFLANLPALAKLKHTLGTIVEQYGFVPGLDGRKVPSRSEHSSINALVQSCGAILCKRWVVNSYKALLADGLKWGWGGDFVFLGWIHDELQIACRQGLGDRVGEIVVQEARKAGEPYGFRVRLDSKYVIGRNWAETH